MSLLLEDFAAQVQSGPPPRRGFCGGGDRGGCTRRGAPSDFFSLLPDPPILSLFPCSLPSCGSRAADPGTVQQNDPKSSLLIQTGTRQETPTASFYQITPFAA